MRTESHLPVEPATIARPYKDLWFLTAILAATGLGLPFFAPSQSNSVNPNAEALSRIGICLLFTLPAIFIAFYCIWCRIVAGSEGLTFRGLLGSRFIPWSAVEDYELRIPAPGQSKSGHPEPFLKVGGKWRKLNHIYKPQEALLERIAREAQWSRARSWQRQDVREDGDWPKTFSYPNESGWKLVGLSLLFFLAMFLQFLVPALFRGVGVMVTNFTMMWSALSWWGRAGLVLVPLSLPASLCTVFWAQYPAILTRRRYREQKIVATHEGLTYTKDGVESFVRWDEIESYYLKTLPGNFQPLLYVVESRRLRIKFLAGITGDKSLRALVEHRANNAATKSWAHLDGADEDVLGGAASLWRGGNVGIGSRVYHYRTRSNRGLLFLGLVMSGLFCFQLSDGYLGNGKVMTRGDYWSGASMVVSLATITLFGWLGYLFASVQCEEDGLRQSGVSAERFIRWDQIGRFEMKGFWFVIGGRSNRIWVAVFIADRKGLAEEIEKRSGIGLPLKSRVA